MSSSEPLRRPWLARTDFRTGLAVGFVLVLSVVVMATLSYAYAAMELLEEADRWLEFSQRIAVHELAEWDSPSEAVPEIAALLPDSVAVFRLVDDEARVVGERGSWPPPEHRVSAIFGATDDRRDLLAFRDLRRERWLVGASRAGEGLTLEIALPLRHFADEANEHVSIIATAGAIAALVVVLVGLGAVAMAFAPLRQGTQLLEGADDGSTGLRLPSRGTGDPIDAHAEALNRVLERIDLAFSRQRAFSSNVAHELNNPLNRIGNVSEVALLGGGEEELREALEGVQSSTEQLSRIVQSLLLLAEIDDRRLELRPESIDLLSWIEHHVEAFAPSFENAGVKLVMDVEPMTIHGDRTLLDRILVNLLDNALTHAPRGTEVAIRTRRTNGSISVCVDDAGAGVSEAHRERIFDRFERIDSDGRPGHGLGLALARAIAQFHGGSLCAGRSRTGGARFELVLPIAPEI